MLNNNPYSILAKIPSTMHITARRINNDDTIMVSVHVISPKASSDKVARSAKFTSMNIL